MERSKLQKNPETSTSSVFIKKNQDKTLYFTLTCYGKSEEKTGEDSVKE